MQAIQTIHADKGINTPSASCGESCGAEEQTRMLMYAVSLLSEERIARASEYETWAFGEILREHVPFYNEMCHMTIHVCYKMLCDQSSNPKVAYQSSNPKIAFAIEFFKKAYLQASEIEMTHQDEEVYSSFVAECAYSYDSDMDEWW